jgi:hypothetical protein
MFLPKYEHGIKAIKRHLMHKLAVPEICVKCQCLKMTDSCIEVGALSITFCLPGCRISKFSTVLEGIWK